MHARTFSSAILLVALASPGALAESTPARGVEPVGPTLWEVSGSVGKASVEPTRGPASWEPTEITPETRLALERLRLTMARAGENPEGPPLKWVVPTDEYRMPEYPPTDRIDSPAIDNLILYANSNPTSVVPGGFSSTVNEPAAAAKENRVFYSMNWWAASSTNGGANWASLNPFSGPFPAVNGGFCCDQTMIYDHHTDTLFFLQQYLDDGTTGTQRINVDMGFDGTWDCSYDFTPASIGQGTGKWFDYPDLALTQGFLFHSSNIFTTGGSFAGGAVMRYPLSGIASCGGFGYNYIVDPGFGSFRFTQGASDTMYFASHISNNSMRIWRWRDSGGSLSTFDRTVNTWSNATRVCPGPDGRDWCGFLDARMTAGFSSNTVIGFMWTAAQDGTYPFPQVRIARFDTAAALTLVDQPVVWSGSTAWAYPAAASNARGDIGGSILYGGGASLYMGCTVFLADVVNGYVLAPLENVVSIAGTIGPSSNRSGDYLTARGDMPNRSRFEGTCFAYNSTTASTSRHVRYGRSSISGDLLRNGFETGNTAEWTKTVP